MPGNRRRSTSPASPKREPYTLEINHGPTPNSSAPPASWNATTERTARAVSAAEAAKSSIATRPEVDQKSDRLTPHITSPVARANV